MEGCNVACAPDPCLREKLDGMIQVALSNRQRAIELRERLFGATPVKDHNEKVQSGPETVDQKLCMLRDIQDETTGILESMLGRV